MKFMKYLLSKQKGLLGIVLILNTICALALAYIAILLQKITDNALLGDTQKLFRQLIFAIAYIIICCGIRYIGGLAEKIFTVKAIQSLRYDLYQGIMRKNNQDFNRENTANYLSYLTNDIKIIEENFIQSFLVIMFNGIYFLGCLVVLFVISPIIGGAMILALLVMLIVPTVFGKALESRQDQVSKQYGIFTTKFKDILNGFQIIKSFNIQGYIDSQFHNQNNEMSKVKYKYDRLNTLSESISEFLAYLTIFGGVFIGAYFVAIGSISAGTMIALIQLGSAILNPFMMIFMHLPKIQGAKLVFKKLEKIINYKDTYSGVKEVTFEKDIKIKELSFTYEGQDEPSLKNINLKLQKNKKYVLVGKSGCGKSTLASILAGDFYSYEGEVQYDGIEIKKVDINGIRQMISIIHQNVFMFDDTIKDNVCLYSKVIKEKMNNALKVSGAYGFANEKKEGISYRVGENGNNLSGGQRQRLAVARGIYDKKPILFIDEGTSAVDEGTAFDIERRLLARKDLTLITITHNLSEKLLSKYDEIIYMEAGKIVEKGNFNRLMSEKGAFYKYYT